MYHHVQHVHSGGGCTRVGTRNTRKFYTFCSILLWKLKMLLKNKIYFKKTKKKSKISTPLSDQFQGILSQKQLAKPVDFQKCPKSGHICPPPTLWPWPKLQKWVGVRGSSWLSHFHHHFLQFTLYRALGPSQLHHTFGGSCPALTLRVFTLLLPSWLDPWSRYGHQDSASLNLYEDSQHQDILCWSLCKEKMQ